MATGVDRLFLMLAMTGVSMMPGLFVFVNVVTNCSSIKNRHSEGSNKWHQPLPEKKAAP